MGIAEPISSHNVAAKEIPIPLIRANQWMLIITTLIAVIISNPWIIIAMLIITFTTLVFGSKMNPAMRIAKPLLGKKLSSAETESVEMQRFNQIISVFCLFLSTLSFALYGADNWLMWVFSSMITVAATAAVCGYCIGCKIYYPYKMSVIRWRSKFPKLKILFDFIAGTGFFKPHFK